MSKTILVTGANGSLGAAVVTHLLAKGYTVIGIDNSLEKLGHTISHERFRFYGADVSDEQLMKTLLPEILHDHQQLHGALMLVGGFAMGDLEATTGTDLQDMFRLNFYSAYHLTRLLYPHFESKQYGRIAFIGARPALEPEAGYKMMAYSLSKSLLFRLADMLNAQSRKADISCSVIVPSVIDTPMNRKSMPDKDPEDWVKPKHIAALLELLFTETGAVLRENVMKVYNRV